MTRDEKLEKLVSAMWALGLDCGSQIAQILKEKYPKAAVFVLYRSAIAIEYDEEKRQLQLHMSGDPHAWGKDITPENVEEMTETYTITGDRFGPRFLDSTGDWVTFVSVAEETQRFLSSLKEDTQDSVEVK